ncbi:hypothetical protein WA1_32015 [Scytonema hofmannii PCC 7110]|uniref:Uncharacterized protein n=1 Tax=Scytonema hofmannii PCC 7110 TaxID=128403 RepID=A0A139X3S3_9CYAN|nr:zinc ribbon domain-containing protein [Scytonema hofmannii]KYC39361.1 hypothetical protein WA1_32015 [Scytonema hofmannii PCC 7110]
METTTCPRCHQPVNSQAVTCPHCRIELKAYGHPGIPLHRATGEKYLCDTCTYHVDESCTYPQRPHAKECILYQNIDERQLELQQQNQSSSFGVTVQNWVRRNQALLLLLALLFICFLIVFFSS